MGNLKHKVGMNIELMKLLNENTATIRTKKIILHNLIENLYELDKDLDELQRKLLENEKIDRRLEKRFLTERECIKLYREASRLGISQIEIARRNHTSKTLIGEVFKGKYKVSPLIKQHFANVGIDLDKIMKEGIENE